MSLPITSQVIDHLKSLGFTLDRSSGVSAGGYYYTFVLNRSVEERELGVLFKDNDRGNPCLACFLVKSGRRGYRDVASSIHSFSSWDDVLAPSFADHVERVVEKAKEAKRQKSEADARAKENEQNRLRVARLLAGHLRDLGIFVDVAAHNLSGRIGHRDASVVVIGDGAYVSFGAHGFVEVGRSVAADLPAVAAKVAAFIAALEAAK